MKKDGDYHKHRRELKQLRKCGYSGTLLEQQLEIVDTLDEQGRFVEEKRSKDVMRGTGANLR